jgi:hypothetical protein
VDSPNTGVGIKLKGNCVSSWPGSSSIYPKGGSGCQTEFWAPLGALIQLARQRQLYQARAPSHTSSLGTFGVVLTGGPRYAGGS